MNERTGGSERERDTLPMMQRGQMAVKRREGGYVGSGSGLSRDGVDSLFGINHRYLLQRRRTASASGPLLLLVMGVVANPQPQPPPPPPLALRPPESRLSSRSSFISPSRRPHPRAQPSPLLAGPAVAASAFPLAAAASGPWPALVVGVVREGAAVALVSVFITQSVKPAAATADSL